MEDSPNIQVQLNAILSELSNLKKDVQGNSLSVATEVKKLKTEKDLVWRFTGNKHQYDFNNEIADIAKQCVWGIENEKFDYVKEQLTELLEKTHKRNKIVRIADTSTGGWETVRQYETNPVASDSDDESRIQKAENRALKKQKTRQRGGLRRSYGNAAVSTWNPSFAGPKPYGPFPSNRGRFFRGPHHTAGFTSATSGSFPPGSCYACGDPDHFRRNCPKYRSAAFASAAGAGNQSANGTVGR